MILSLLLAASLLPLSPASVANENGESHGAAGTGELNFPDSQNITRITFGSCHKTKFGRPDLWPMVLADDPQVWLWTGDSIYPRGRDRIAPVANLQAEYQRMKAVDNVTIGYGAQIAARRNSMHVWGSWDDHDYGANDHGVHLTEKHARRKAFWDFLDLPDRLTARLASREGAYFSVTVGQAPNKVKILLLDTRWNRDNHCIPSVAAVPWIPLGAGFACATRWITAGLVPSLCRWQQQQQQQQPSTILGKEQWTWLEQQLDDDSVAVNIVVSSVQMLTTNPTMEGWGHFPHERERLIRLLTGTQLHGAAVVVLSGDVHHGEILDPSIHFPTNNNNDKKNTFLEVTSSGLTHTCTKGLTGPLCQPLLTTFHKHRFQQEEEDEKNGDSKAAAAYYLDRNFGRIALDWERRRMQVTVHNAETGQVVLSTKWRSMQQYQDWTEEELNSVAECMDGHLIPLAVSVAVVLVTATLVVMVFR